MKTMTLSRISLCALAGCVVGLTGCATLEDDADFSGVDVADLGEISDEIGTGCGNLPPCDCALRGSPMCADPDGDSVPTLYDNCAHAPNPGQANCDGDAIGDACDSDSSVVVNQSVGVRHVRYFDGAWFCAPLAQGNRTAYYQYEEREYTTYLTLQMCGLSGNGFENRTSVENQIHSIRLVVLPFEC